MPILYNFIEEKKNSAANNTRYKRHIRFHFGSQIANNFSLVTLQFNKYI